MAEIRPTRHQTRSGKIYFIRSAQGKDAERVLESARSVIDEQSYSLATPEEFVIGVEQEIDFIESFRKDPLKLFLVAEAEDKKIIGTLDFAPGQFLRTRHVGEFGMGVIREFRSEGVGTALLETLLSWASGVSSLEKINLAVHADNDPAIALYRKFGFEVEGVRKRETRMGANRYVDSVLMAKFLRS